MRLAGLAKGGYYPTPMRCVDLVSQPRNSPDTESGWKSRKRSGSSTHAADQATPANGWPPSYPIRATPRYGPSAWKLERERAQQAQEQMDFALSSDLFQAMIANNAFHVLYLNPPYDFDQEDKRVEHAFLTHCTRYLVNGGLLMLVVPRHRLSVSARFLAANYDRLECRRFPDPEYDDFDQVILMGNRRAQPAVNQYSERRILNWAHCSTEQIKTLDDDDDSTVMLMFVPTGERTEVLFTIRTVDPAQAATEARKSGLWTNQAIQDSLWPLHTTKTQPLMPLRLGHMAMLVAAGFLDNLCLEANGKRILVKGRTVKKMELVSATEDEEIWQGPDVHHHPDAGPEHRKSPRRADPEQGQES